MIVALTAPALASDPLVNLRTAVPSAVLDVRYASPRNFTGKTLYPEAAAFLRRSTAVKLARAAEALRPRGLRLVIYDAYRPLSVQRALWAAKPDRRFVADPTRRGSAHNRGGAVDVGLADADGHVLEMPTDFDAFDAVVVRAIRKDAAKVPCVTRTTDLTVDRGVIGHDPVRIYQKIGII